MRGRPCMKSPGMGRQGGRLNGTPGVRAIVSRFPSRTLVMPLPLSAPCYPPRASAGIRAGAAPGADAVGRAAGGRPVARRVSCPIVPGPLSCDRSARSDQTRDGSMGTSGSFNRRSSSSSLRAYSWSVIGWPLQRWRHAATETWQPSGGGAVPVTRSPSGCDHADDRPLGRRAGRGRNDGDPGPCAPPDAGCGRGCIAAGLCSWDVRVSRATGRPPIIVRHTAEAMSARMRHSSEPTRDRVVAVGGSTATLASKST